MMRTFTLARLTHTRVAILSLLVFTCFCLTLRYQQREAIKMESVFREYPDVDELDYHFIAVNFALKNQFPVLGYLDKPSAYKFRYTPDVDNLYLNIFKVSGPVYTFIRPPLYPLLVGMMYKIFGFHLSTLIWINILMVAATIGLFPYIAFNIWSVPGFFAGLLASIIMFFSMNYRIMLMDIEILGALLYFVMFYLALLIEKDDLWKYRLCLGILFGLELLERPTFIFLIPFYLIYYYLFKNQASFASYLKKILPIILGIILLILPWILYSNYIQMETVAERKTWAEKTMANVEKPVLFNSKKEIAGSHKNTVIALQNLVRFKLVRDLRINNEFLYEDDGLLYVNNEYCINNIADMDCYGWLWKFIRTSYYNTHNTSHNTVAKVMHFYLDNPGYIYKIPLERLKFSAEYPLIFWLAPALWGLSVICFAISALKNNLCRILCKTALWILFIGFYILAFDPNISGHVRKVMAFVPVYVIAALLWKRHYNSMLPIIYPLFWLSIFIYILFIWGDMRFTFIMLPINCCVIFYYSYTFIKFTVEDGIRKV
jgi:4-amino-4-deoxy-L-arabinose transferase-like glycosyltransferase